MPLVYSEFVLNVGYSGCIKRGQYVCKTNAKSRSELFDLNHSKKYIFF